MEAVAAGKSESKCIMETPEYGRVSGLFGPLYERLLIASLSQEGGDCFTEANSTRGSP